MKYVVAYVSIALSVLLALWLLVTVVAVIALKGPSAVQRELIAAWPQNLIFGIIATLVPTLLSYGIGILASRERRS